MRRPLSALRTQAVGFVFLQANDELFVAGAPCQHAYRHVSGEMTYSQEPDTSEVLMSESQPVDAKSWICVGTAAADSNCQFVRVSAEGLAGCMQKHVLVKSITTSVGKAKITFSFFTNVFLFTFLTFTCILTLYIFIFFFFDFFLFTLFYFGCRRVSLCVFVW